MEGLEPEPVSLELPDGQLLGQVRTVIRQQIPLPRAVVDDNQPAVGLERPPDTLQESPAPGLGVSQDG